MHIDDARQADIELDRHLNWSLTDDDRVHRQFGHDIAPPRRSAAVTPQPF